jgi:hypothetical protein
VVYSCRRFFSYRATALQTTRYLVPSSTLSNVLVLQVRIDVPLYIPTTQLVSSGSGVVATGGHVLDI